MLPGLSGLEVILRGKNLHSSATVTFSGDGIQVLEESLDPIYVSSLSRQILIAADAPPGPRDVIVTSPEGKSAVLPDAFVVVESAPKTAN